MSDVRVIDLIANQIRINRRGATSAAVWAENILTALQSSGYRVVEDLCQAKDGDSGADGIAPAAAEALQSGDAAEAYPVEYEERAAMRALRGKISKRATSAEFNEWMAREVCEYIDRLRNQLDIAREDIMCTHMSLDDIGAPRDIGGNQLSIIGRVQARYAEARLKSAKRDEVEPENSSASLTQKTQPNT
jgi:hypothetical protein